MNFSKFIKIEHEKMHSAIHSSNFELWQMESDYIIYMEITKKKS